MQVYGVGFRYGSRFLDKTGFHQKRKFEKKNVQKISFSLVLEAHSLFLMLVPFQPI